MQMFRPNPQMFPVGWELENLHFATSSLGDSDVDGSGTEEEPQSRLPSTTSMQELYFY